MADFTTEVELKDIVIRDTEISTAVDEPIRAMILDLMSGEEQTVRDVHEELERRGFDRTRNTVRHHINELREAGLVEVTRFEEHRGATRKYYRANTIVLSYAIPDDAEDRIDEMIEYVQPRVDELLASMNAEFHDAYDEIAREMEPCDHCRTQKYDIFLRHTVLRRALVRSLS